LSGAQTSRLGAWSRRRAAVQAEDAALKQAEHQAEVATRHAALAEKSEAEMLAELDLPQPDDMKAGDDFSAFMKETVPAALRNRALRKLWLSDPALANIDNLVDYGEDFAAEAKMGGVVKTIYQVGKGMLADQDEDEDEVAEVIAPPTDDMAQEAPDDMALVEDIEAHENVAGMEDIAVPAEDLPPLAIRRKMKFRFADSDVANLANNGMNEQ